jgi:hypothetical protein
VTLRPGVVLGFSALLAVMIGHEAEHVVQVLQKDAIGASCPNDCRGLLGFAFDLEWIHFVYNASIELGLLAVAVALRLWRAPRTFAWVLLSTAVVVQGYHVVEHTQKLLQWFENGRSAPTPGILGSHVSLVELHFALNTVVFALVVGGYVGFGFHRALARLLAPPRRAATAVALAGLAVAATFAAWSQRPPTVRLAAGVHEGPIVIDRPQRLVGEPGAVVVGGIVVRADDVVVRDLLVVADGENGIDVDGADDVLIERVGVRGARLDGIHARRSSVTIRDCVVESSAPYAQGIDISFSFDKAPSLVQGCTVSGGLEGIVTHMTKATIRENRVSDSSLRGIAVTEMSMGTVHRNEVSDTVGVGIYCGDYSRCTISGNSVRNVQPDEESSDALRAGIGILAHFGAHAVLSDNGVSGGYVDAHAHVDSTIER